MNAKPIIIAAAAVGVLMLLTRQARAAANTTNDGARRTILPVVNSQSYSNPIEAAGRLAGAVVALTRGFAPQPDVQTSNPTSARDAVRIGDAYYGSVAANDTPKTTGDFTRMDRGWLGPTLSGVAADVVKGGASVDQSPIGPVYDQTYDWSKEYWA